MASKICFYCCIFRSMVLVVGGDCWIFALIWLDIYLHFCPLFVVRIPCLSIRNLLFVFFRVSKRGLSGRKDTTFILNSQIISSGKIFFVKIIAQNLWNIGNSGVITALIIYINMENNIVSLAYIIKDTAQPEIVWCLLPLCDTIVVSIYNLSFIGSLRGCLLPLLCLPSAR